MNTFASKFFPSTIPMARYPVGRGKLKIVDARSVTDLNGKNRWNLGKSKDC